MNPEDLQSFFGWMTLLNSGILLFWAILLMRLKNWVYEIHSRWFDISREEFDSIHYRGMAYFKMAIILLNLAPYVALGLAT